LPFGLGCFEAGVQAGRHGIVQVIADLRQEAGPHAT
jgi:hypothetical protein